MATKASQCPILLAICDHKNTLRRSIQPIEVIETAIDLHTTIVGNCGFIFSDGRPSDEHIQVEFSLEDMLTGTIRFQPSILVSSQVDFEFSSQVTPKGLIFQREIHDHSDSRDKYTLNISSEMLTRILETRSSAGNPQSNLQSVQNTLSIQQEKNRELIAAVQELRQTPFTQYEWAHINHGETHAYAERLEEKFHQLNEELEEAADRSEERFDALTEDNKRLEGFEVQVAELDEKLRTLITKAQDGKVDVGALLDLRKTIK